MKELLEDEKRFIDLPNSPQSSVAKPSVNQTRARL